MSGTLVVFAKQPLPGQVKTRLCPPFTPELAADFYACMLEDVLETTLRASAALGLGAVLALQPPDAAATFSAPVGLRRPVPGLFSHPMSTAEVLADTLAQAEQARLTYALLPAGFDIDTAADLALLAEARRQGAARECPRTLAFLDRNGLWHGQEPGPSRSL